MRGGPNMAEVRRKALESPQLAQVSVGRADLTAPGGRIGVIEGRGGAGAYPPIGDRNLAAAGKGTSIQVRGKAVRLDEGLFCYSGDSVPEVVDAAPAPQRGELSSRPREGGV